MVFLHVWRYSFVWGHFTQSFASHGNYEISFIGKHQKLQISKMWWWLRMGRTNKPYTECQNPFHHHYLLPLLFFHIILKLKLNEHDLMHLFNCLHNSGIYRLVKNWLTKLDNRINCGADMRAHAIGRYDTMQIKLQSRIENVVMHKHTLTHIHAHPAAGNNIVT